VAKITDWNRVVVFERKASSNKDAVMLKIQSYNHFGRTWCLIVTNLSTLRVFHIPIYHWVTNWVEIEWKYVSRKISGKIGHDNWEASILTSCLADTPHNVTAEFEKVGIEVKEVAVL
jgi:hypothetical protein